MKLASFQNKLELKSRKSTGKSIAADAFAFDKASADIPTQEAPLDSNQANHEAPILELKGVTKSFPGVKALTDVSFKVRTGSILSIVGENGAGKSTLLKVISGVIPSGKYSGNFFFKGRVCSYGSIRDSERDGIVIIHQELAVSPYLTLYENIFLNHYRSKGGVIDWNSLVILSKYYLDQVGLKKNPATMAGSLTVAEQQLLEIAKALAKNAKLLILDEPTSSLNDDDSFALLDTMKKLRDENGVTCIFVSHKLKEVEYVADDVTVLRDGRHISDYDNRSSKIEESRLIKDIVGRELTSKFPISPPRKFGEYKLEVQNLAVDHATISGKRVVKDASFAVRAGEIVGISGLVGSGRSEMAMNVFGQAFGIRRRGSIIMNGIRVNFHSPHEAIKAGLMYASEDRKNEGLIQMFSVQENIAMASNHVYSRMGVLRKGAEVQNARLRREELRVKVPNIEYPVETLSGGNQQKVLLAKALSTQCQVLIVDEPTKGIDVGSKYEIYAILQTLAAQGKAIVVISSEIEELLGTTDRIYVMSEGVIKGELPTAKATPEKIMAIAIGKTNAAGSRATRG